MITKETIMEAYVFLRKNNQSIPCETLDFIKDASLKALEASNTEIIGSVSDTWLCIDAGKGKKRCEKQCVFCGGY